MIGDDKKDGVIDWLLAEHSEDMLQRATDAGRGDQDLASFALEEKKYPIVIQKLLDDPALRKAVEKLLDGRKIRKDILEFCDCGGEAVVLRIKGVPNVLLKISIFKTEGASCPFVVQPHHRLLASKPGVGEDTTQVSIAFTPLMEGYYHYPRDVGITREQKAAYTPYDPNGPLHQQYDSPPKAKISFKMLENLIHECSSDQGWLAFLDQTIRNIRFHPDYDAYPFVIDMRAVGPINKKHETGIFPEQFEELKSEYTQVMDRILLSTWGKGEEAVKNIMAKAYRVAKGSTEIS